MSVGGKRQRSWGGGIQRHQSVSYEKERSRHSHKAAEALRSRGIRYSGYHGGNYITFEGKSW